MQPHQRARLAADAQPSNFEQAVTGVVVLTNPLASALEITLRAASPERWTVTPSTVRVDAGASVQLRLTLIVRRATPATLRGVTKARKAAQQRAAACAHLVQLQLLHYAARRRERNASAAAR